MMKVPNLFSIHFVTISVFSVILAGCAKDQPLDIKGTWTINIDKSIRESIATGELPESKAQMLRESLSRRLEGWKISLSGDSITFMGNKLNYDTLSASDSEAVIQFEVVDQPVVLTFTEYDSDSIYIRSSATNDMDNLIWDKTG